MIALSALNLDGIIFTVVCLMQIILRIKKEIEK